MIVEEIKSIKGQIKNLLGKKNPWTQQEIHENSTYNDIYFCLLYYYYGFGEVPFHPHKVPSFTAVDRAIRELYCPLGRVVKISEQRRVRDYYANH